MANNAENLRESMSTETKQIDDGGPAFPVPMWPRQADGQPMSSHEYGLGGMTLRDYFAAKALNGLIQRKWSDESGNVPSDVFQRWAKGAYLTADAMLAARRNQPNCCSIDKDDFEQTLANILNAFMKWPLPKSLNADGCVTRPGLGRTGTNIMTVDETAAMVNEVVRPHLEGLIKDYINEKGTM